MSDSSSESPFRNLGSSSGQRRRGSSSGSGKRGRILPPVFDPDDIVADRYKIIRFIGRGGMGEVYEAEDLDLDVRVALKTVRPEIADNDVALERFRREIQLARKVTHPNVCRIFDVGHHRLEATEEQEEREIVFLTMEHIEGETLAKLIREDGRFDEESALPIVEQITAAIDAAHGAGIVHRDFKSSNVILSDDPAYPGGVRAVITDFGLARGILPGDALTTSLSSSSQALGTPTYMAPEQVAGSEITQAADIYSLGVVVFEMMTGRPPFMSDSPLSTAVKRLMESPPPPRSMAPDLSSRWETGILRCLERDPDARFEKAGDLALWIKGLPLSAQGSSAWRSHRSLIMGVATVLILAIAGGLLWLRSPAPDRPLGPDRSDSSRYEIDRPLAAVIGFRDLSGQEDMAWLSTALQEMLSMELAASEQVRVVPGDIVARVRRELGIERFRTLSTEEINRIARNLGADIVFLGSYYVEDATENPEIRIDVRAHRAGSREMISPVIQTGQRSELLEIVSRTGEQIRAKLGYAENGIDTSTALVASYPVDPDATRLYAQGVEALRRGDPISARDDLQQSIEHAGDNPLAYSALASAWSSLGYDARAREASRRAMEMSEGLPREERLLIEARYHEAASQWDEAIATYRRLRGIAPDNIEYGLSLARAQANAGDAQALETIDELRDVASPSYQTRIDLAGD
ncbi:MAG: protein kinase, partial [Thermoanaerobaculia bacterium]|nr:protein kinase [Thermoanaerobaculia bacterium]